MNDIALLATMNGGRRPKRNFTSLLGAIGTRIDLVFRPPSPTFQATLICTMDTYRSHRCIDT